MEKIIALGDTHGRHIWEAILEKEYDYTKVIFIGDYFDSREGVSAVEQIHNFKNICRLKSENPEKVTLLFGNHDFHYLRGAGESYSGHQTVNAHDISEVLEEAVKNKWVQMVDQYSDMLFSHAGITKTWLNNIFGNEMAVNNPAFLDLINDMFYFQPRVFKFTPGDLCDMYGDEPTQSPIWVRPKSLLADKPEGYKQCVGHTTHDHISHNQDVIFIDTLGTTGEYLVIRDRLLTSGTLKQS